MSRIVVLVLLATTVAAKPGHNCPPNESWSECGRLCERSCDSPNFLLCPMIQCSYITEGCRCDAGFARNSNGLCVNVAECQSPTIADSVS